MNAKNLTDLHWFCQAVHHGGYAAASRHHQTSAPTLSRAVTRLEQTLGEKLIHRSAKQFQLTASGEECYQRFAQLLEQVDHAWLAKMNTQPTLSGAIHVSCPEPFADHFLQATAIEFMRQHPEVTIRISFGSDISHFFDDQVDLAVVSSPATAPQLIQRRLFDSHLMLAAAPEYLDQQGRPESIHDLAGHDLLSGNTMTAWELTQNGENLRLALSPRYSVNSLRLSIKAACQGMGICLAPRLTLAPFLARGELEALLPDVVCPAGTIHLVWADRQLVSARVMALRDLIVSRLEDSDSFLSAISHELP